jgi:hypothetical protein
MFFKAGQVEKNGLVTCKKSLLDYGKVAPLNQIPFKTYFYWQLILKKKHFWAYISVFQHTNNVYQVIYAYTTAQLCFPENLIPWRDSNPGIRVVEIDKNVHCQLVFFR